LEALKEAIRQEVAAITPEMVLKVMDNYREATSVYQYSRPLRSKHVDVKQHSVCFPEIEKHLPYLLWF